MIGLLYIFLDPEMPSIDLKILESRKTLWGKTKAAFKYIYEHHRFVFISHFRYLSMKTLFRPQYNVSMYIVFAKDSAVDKQGVKKKVSSLGVRK